MRITMCVHDGRLKAADCDKCSKLYYMQAHRSPLYAMTPTPTPHRLMKIPSLFILRAVLLRHGIKLAPLPVHSLY